MVPFCAAIAAFPKLTFTIPLVWVVTFTFEYCDRSSITLSRWSSRLLALIPAACAWAIWPFSCAIWLASLATAPLLGSVSVLYWLVTCASSVLSCPESVLRVVGHGCAVPDDALLGAGARRASSPARPSR